MGRVPGGILWEINPVEIFLKTFHQHFLGSEGRLRGLRIFQEALKGLRGVLGGRKASEVVPREFPRHLRLSQGASEGSRALQEHSSLSQGSSRRPQGGALRYYTVSHPHGHSRGSHEISESLMILGIFHGVSVNFRGIPGGLRGNSGSGAQGISHFLPS